MPRKKIKDRPRYPSGKLKPEVAAPTLVRRILNSAIKTANNPLLGSALGRHRLADQIDSDQLAAGMHFAEIVASWHRVQGLPLPFPKTASLQQGLGKSLSGETPPHIVEATGKAYRNAMRALNAAGRSAARVVASVAILDRSTIDHGALCAGLTALSNHFRLTKSYR